MSKQTTQKAREKGQCLGLCMNVYSPKQDDEDEKQKNKLTKRQIDVYVFVIFIYQISKWLSSLPNSCGATMFT